MSKTFYVTTPIYYVNAEPHVGSATSTLLCDSLARFHRLRGDSTFFLTGTDEQASKVSEAAAKAGETTMAFVDRVSQRFRDTWSYLHVANDDFIRTTEQRHIDTVSEVFRRLQARGDIYSGTYEGWYSIADETFYRDSEVEDGFAKETRTPVQWVTEDSYYFRLSSYGDRLLRHIEENEGFLQPATRRNEVIAFIKEGLRDIAISRTNAGWGIPVPGDERHVIYVWFDAVINYLAATGWPDRPGWDTVWPADVHLVGKEIYARFHATLWPAMLMGLDLPLPRTVLGHGWWLVRDPKTLELIKGSKTLGNIPTPQDAVEEIIRRSGASRDVAVDALRYYLVRDISYSSDAEFSLDALFGHYNGDLANKLGNLLNRTLTMLTQYAGGIVPEGSPARTAGAPYAAFAREAVVEAEQGYLALAPGTALDAGARLVKGANEELDTQAPWRRHKAGDVDGVADALYTALEACRLASLLLMPVLPTASALIREQLGLKSTPLGSWQQEAQWGGLPAGQKTQPGEPIFPRGETRKTPVEAREPQPKREPVKERNDVSEIDGASADNLISIDDFARVQLRVAEIKTAERVEKANKLLRLTVDAGDGQDRQIVAGIAESYAPEDLPGRKIVIVANLAPARIRGIDSQGMLLAATNADGKAILLTPSDSAVPAGSQVR